MSLFVRDEICFVSLVLGVNHAVHYLASELIKREKQYTAEKYHAKSRWDYKGEAQRRKERVKQII